MKGKEHKNDETRYKDKARCSAVDGCGPLCPAPVLPFRLFLFGPKEERTEWIVDGEYAYLGEEETVEKLMEYIQAGDADSIYQVFSQTAKDNSNNLREKSMNWLSSSMAR